MEDVKKTKQVLGWPVDPPFLVPAPALAHFRQALERGARAQDEWNERLTAYAEAFPELAQELKDRLNAQFPPDWDADNPVFAADAKGMATRVAGGKGMKAIAGRLPAVGGGAADWAATTTKRVEGRGDVEGGSDWVAVVSGAERALGVQGAVVAEFRTDDQTSERFRSRRFDVHSNGDRAVGGASAADSSRVECDIATAQAIRNVVILRERSDVESVSIAPDLAAQA